MSKLSRRQLITTGLAATAGASGLVVAARLADRYGRKPVMIWPQLFTLLATYPAFLWIVHSPGELSLLFATTTVDPVPVMPPAATTSFFIGTIVIGCVRILLSATSVTVMARSPSSTGV